MFGYFCCFGSFIKSVCESKEKFVIYADGVEQNRGRYSMQKEEEKKIARK